MKQGWGSAIVWRGPVREKCPHLDDLLGVSHILSSMPLSLTLQDEEFPGFDGGYNPAASRLWCTQLVT